MKNNKGFSLIELIIVIAIMAVLVAIIAPNLTKYLGQSKHNADVANMDTVKEVIEQACALSGVECSEPQNLGTWVELKEGSDYYNSSAADINGYMAFSRYVSSILNEVPVSKETGKNFEVKITGASGSKYIVEIRVKS